jgi:hypothetical protein
MDDYEYIKFSHIIFKSSCIVCVCVCVCVCVISGRDSECVRAHVHK